MSPLEVNAAVVAAAAAIYHQYHMVLPVLALAVGGASEVLRRTVR
ncbi:MAG TPA: hypothetical protein VFA63_07740 [Pseudonocardiaceae bacterium]|nr:hypothetical protein [Pseudonocardiaceae bacterium]